MVLVVDDDAPIRRMLVRTLTAEGFEATASPDGGAALAAIERSTPDLLVLDVSMPGLDGLEVCRRVRAKGLGLPILLLTARDAVADRVAGLDAGADDYLVKPFAAEELVARVRALLRRGREPAEVLAYGDLVFDVPSGSARRGGREMTLSGREADLLELLLRNSTSGRHARARARTRLGQRRPRRARTSSTATFSYLRREAGRAAVDRDRARHRLHARR